MLGFMTEAEALELLDKIVKDFHGNGYYKSLREVTKKEWDEFYHLKILTGISNRLKWIKRYNDVPETVVNDISTKIGKLSGRLGLCHRWEHVVE